MFKILSFKRAFSVKRIPGFQSIALITFLLLYAPIIILIIYSFNYGTTLSIWEGFSLKWYKAAWNNDAVQEAAFRSLYLAATAATIATTAATMAALATTRTKKFKGSTFIYTIINQPLMVP